jgi:hypothetical protein
LKNCGILIFLAGHASFLLPSKEFRAGSILGFQVLMSLLGGRKSSIPPAAKSAGAGLLLIVIVQRAAFGRGLRHHAVSLPGRLPA